MEKAFKQRCRQIRKDILEIARHGKRGHIASAFSMVEIMVSLYDSILRVDPKNPEWPDRDRFILSKGHGCLALYAILGDKGFISKESWKGFCAFDGILGGHPTMEKIPGVEASTGALGHGLPIGVGFAIAAKLSQKDYRTFVLVGDGECNEGSVWEAAMAAAKHQLDNLIVLVDYNKYQAFASTREVCDLEPFLDKWIAFGFAAREVEIKENSPALTAILSEVPFTPGKPTAIICHTLKGLGSPIMENDLTWHHKSGLRESDINALVAHLED